MTVEKSVLRAQLFEEVGSSIRSTLDAYQRELKEHEGALNGLHNAVQSVEGLLAHISKDIDENKLDIEVAKIVKLWMQRAVTVVGNLKQASANRILISKGKIEAVEKQLDTIKKAFDVEKGRLRLYTQQPDSPVVTADNVVDITSAEREAPRSLKERRIQEEISQKDVPAVPTAPPANAPIQLKRRGRKPKNAS
jgi:chromosome segregation ATPase